jgi:glycosyltransferase involved in cell wall biosynthesis
VARAFRIRRSREHARHDVVFYMPWIGSMLSRRAHLPPGGAETQVLMLAKGLVGRGLRVAIIAFGDPDELPAQVAGVDIVPRAQYRKRQRMIGKLVEIVHIWRSLWHTPSSVVVYRGAGLQLGLIALYTRLARRHLIFSSANIIDFDYRKLVPNRRDHFIYRLGTRLADTIVVQTEEQVELCQASFGRRPVLIKSIAPLEADQAQMPEAFLWVGRLVSYKHPLEYIALARALPEAKFWMVGVPIPQHADSELVTAEVIARADGVPNLELLPPRRHEELVSLMDRTVASVNTAEFEGMPNVLLEAWTRGVPALVLTHDPGGVVERYGLGDYAHGSAEQLAVLAREQWRTRGERPEVSQRCRAYIEAFHAPDTVVAGWVGIVGGGTPVVGDKALAEVEPTCAA